MSNTHIPLISSGTAGPLGVLHLPRLWLKTSLKGRNKLADGYPSRDKGFDQMVIDGLGLDRSDVLDFIWSSLPTYPAFEAWIKSRPGVKLDKASVDTLNSAIKGYIHDDATRKSILSANAIADDGSTCKDAVNLNNLNDWKEFHEEVLIWELGGVVHMGGPEIVADPVPSTAP